MRDGLVTIRSCEVEECLTALFDVTDKKDAGVADGAQRDILDIIALNVRTEITFGQFTDGCTSLYWRDEQHTFLGQNWDVSYQFYIILLCSLKEVHNKDKKD